MSSYENLGKYLTPAQQWGAKPSLPQWFNLPIDTAAYAYLTSFDIAWVLQHALIAASIRSIATRVTLPNW